jgi:hypothetical protein
VRVCATGHLEHNLEHWKLHIGFDSLSSITRGPCARPTTSVLKLGRRDARAREARAADPRAPVEAETRVTGRPAAPARYAVSFMFPRILRALSRLTALRCGLCVFASLSSLFQERGLPRNYRVAYARCSCELLMIPADGDLSDCDHSLQKRALLTNEAVLRV